MINFTKILFIVAISNLFIANLSAQAKISIQGTLKDSKGAAVADGSQTVTFKLYNVATGGSSLWSETDDVIVTGGIYSHYLGSVTPLNTSIFSSTLYLGVNIGSLELSPRIELTYAPYAFAVQEVVCSGAVGDVKYSILNPTQFAAVNGACWVPMDGRDITGSRLNSITGQTSVPNGGGLFIRAQEFSNSQDHDPNRSSGSAIAQFEDQSTQTHQHSGSTSFVGDHQHNIDLRFSNGSATGDIGNLGGFYPASNSSTNTGSAMIAASDRTNEGTTHNMTVGQAGGHSHSITTGDNNGFNGPETRPKNLNFWVYMRVN